MRTIVLQQGQPSGLTHKQSQRQGSGLGTPMGENLVGGAKSGQMSLPAGDSRPGAEE